ncbi:MAG: putative O-glycosylation ligase, exosortase A system-associated [Rubrivivax sp.]
MRDLVILAMLVVATLWSLRHPWIGVMSWSLVSLMSPHMQFGYAAAGWPVATGIAICTLLGLLVTKEKQNPMVGAGSWWLLAFALWICITLPFSIFFNESYLLWERSMKIYLMLFVTLALITTKFRLDVFIWICVVSIAYYGVKGGVFTILTGGNHRVWGPGGFIEGNNEIAIAVLSVVPLMRYLQLQMKNKRAVQIMTASMVLCVVTALGTHSRGALLALAGMGLFFWLKSDRKIVFGIAIVVLGIGALSLMPEQWWERMDTIKSYQSDASAQGRINAWWMAWHLAQDRIFGGGFSIWNSIVFQRYAPVPDDPHAAHSIYFQIMGEHGFVGLFLFMAIGAATWWAARDMNRIGRSRPDLKWATDLGSMIQVSMIAFAIGGAFLSLAYYDLPYNVMVMAMLGRRFAQQQALAPAGAGMPAPSAATLRGPPAPRLRNT